MTKFLLVSVGAVIALSACGPASTQPTDETVTVFGPYRGSDAASFSEVLSQFQDETGIRVDFVGTGSVVRSLPERVAAGNAPDIAILPQPAVVADLVALDLLVPLDNDTAAAVRTNYAPALQDLMEFNGTLYGVLYRVNVKSLVWYPPDVFARLGYEVPATWEAMISLTETMEEDGFEPWCFSVESFEASGWVGTDWIEDIILRKQGIDTYNEWVVGNVRFGDPVVLDAFEEFGAIVRTPGRVFGGVKRSLRVYWADAANPMFQDEPKCLLHRQASFYRSQLPEETVIGKDVDVFVLPAFSSTEEPPLLVGGDLAVAFSDRPEVNQLMAYLASPRSGEPWAEVGGYTSPHTAFDSTRYVNAFDQRMGQLLKSAQVVAFDGSDQMTPAVGVGTFWEGIIHYLLTGDLESTVELIESGFDDAPSAGS